MDVPPPIICVLGPPAAGKGTLCTKLSQDYNLYHFSLGDYLRSLSRDPECPVNKKVVDLFRQGGLFPIEFLAPLIREKIEKERGNGYAGIILDGFPRSKEQLEGYEDCKNFDIAVFFDCARDTVKKRYLSRKLPGRLDDDEALFNKRYEEYERLNPEVVDYFRHKGVLLEVDMSGSIDESYSSLLKGLRERSAWNGIASKQKG